MTSFPAQSSASAPLVLFAVTAALLGCRSTDGAGRPDGAAGAAPPLPPVAVEHVALDLAVDPLERWIGGRAALRLRAEAPRVEWLPLRAEGLRVERVVDVDGAPLAFTHTGGELTIILDEPLLAGEVFDVAIDYGGHPERGLTFVDEPDLGERVVHTDGRPGTSAWWFPSVVRPGQAVTSELTLALPASWDAVGSGARERVETEDGATIRFVAELPHALDAVGFAAGPLLRVARAPDDLGGVELAVLGSPARRAALDAALDELEGAARFAVEFLGGDALPRSLALAHLPSAARPGAGALGVAFVGRVDPATVVGETFDRVLAAGLVPERWGDAWVAPALGHYVAALYVERQSEREALSAALDAEAAASAARRPSGPSGALASEQFVDPSDLVDGGWRGPVGAQVLHLVRGAIGDEPFLTGLRAFLDGARGSTVDDDALFAALAAAGGRDLDTLRAQWVDSPGAPRFEVSWEWDRDAREVALRVQQNQSGDDGTPRVFEVPVEVEIVAGAQTEVHRATLAARSETLRFPVATRPRWVRFDRGGWLPGEIVERKTADEWMALAAARDDALGRAVAVEALAAEARGARRSDQAIYLTQLGGRLERDPSARVRIAAARALGSVGGEAARLWLERATVEDDDARVRSAALEALIAYAPSVELASLAVDRLRQDPAVAPAALALRTAAEPETAGAFLRSHWTTAADPRVRAALIASLAAAEGSESEPWLVSAASDPSQPLVVRRAALGALAERERVEPTTAEGVAALLSSTSLGVREAAVDALAAWPVAPARRALEAYYASSVEPTERRAIEAALRLER